MVPRKLICVSRHQINHGDGVICMQGYQILLYKEVEGSSTDEKDEKNRTKREKNEKNKTKEQDERTRRKTRTKIRIKD
jgi:hypothetical protein